MEVQLINEQNVLGKNFRVYGTLERPLFLAKDVAEWIDYDLSSINKLVQLIDDDEKVRNNVPTLGGVQEMWMFTEDGLYEVLFQSRKPIAKQFKKEVKRVLKTIRTKGGVVSSSKLFVESYFSDLDENAKQFIITTLDSKKKIIEENQRQKELLIEQAPKADFFDAVADSKDAISIGSLAKVLGIKGMGRNNLFEFLRQNKVLMNDNTPYQRYVDSGMFRVVEQKYMRDGEPCINIKTLVYQKGVNYVRSLIMNKHAI